MATAAQHDEVEIYLTGASYDGGAQDGHTESLGNYRSSTRVGCLTAHRYLAMAGIRIDYISAANGVGLGGLSAHGGSSLRWKPPGQDAGAAVTIANGATAVIGGATGYEDRYVVVTRTQAANLTGTETIQLLDTVNNVIGGSNFSGDETAAGEEKRRALTIKNGGTSNLTGLVFWFDDDYNTDAQIAKETPVSDALQDMADEYALPAGLSWSTPVTEGGGLAMGTIAAGGMIGLRIEQNVSASTSADPYVLTVIYWSADGGRSGTLRGVNRRAENGIAGYCMFNGQDAAPDLTGTPDVCDAAGPLTSAALTVSHDYYNAVVARNQYGLLPLDIAYENFSSGTVTTKGSILTIAADASADAAKPQGPASVTLTPAANGNVTVESLYYANREGTTPYAIDANRAVDWLVFLTSDGTDPDPDNDTPTVVDMMGGDMMFERINWTSDTGALEDAPIKVCVRTRRVDDGPVNVDSANATIYSTTAQWWGPASPSRPAVSLNKTQGVQQASALPSETTLYIYEAGSCRWVYGPGYSQLWDDTTLVWNIKYDSGNTAINGLYTTFTTAYEAVSGAGTTDAVERVDANTWYVTVNGVRRLKINLATNQITFLKFSAVEDVSTTRANVPIWRKYAHTCFQVFDPTALAWVTPMSLSSDGTWATDIPMKFKATQAECL